MKGKHRGQNSWRNTVRKFPTADELKLLEPLFCGNCQYLSLKENEQTDNGDHHICNKYKKRVLHGGYHPKIVRLVECDEPMEIEV